MISTLYPAVWYILMFLSYIYCDIFNVSAACAGCYVLGAIHANSWLLAYGQGIFLQSYLM
jgi:hypothetical protein